MDSIEASLCASPGRICTLAVGVAKKIKAVLLLGASFLPIAKELYSKKGLFLQRHCLSNTMYQSFNTSTLFNLCSHPIPVLSADVVIAEY